jgi:hypothetical protein
LLGWLNRWGKDKCNMWIDMENEKSIHNCIQKF